MAFDFEALLEGDEDYGLDAFLRAITKAAYDQGFVRGLEAKDQLSGQLTSLTSVLNEVTKSLKVDQSPGGPQFGLTTHQTVTHSAEEPARVPNVLGSGRRVLNLGDPDVSGRSRVARGLVQQTVAMALELEPGRSIKEYEVLVLQLEPEISIKSVGNELRRGEADGRYKRDRPGGYRWYLGSHEIEAADHVADDAAASYSNEGGSDGPDNMT